MFTAFYRVQQFWLHAYYIAGKPAPTKEPAPALCVWNPDLYFEPVIKRRPGRRRLTKLRSYV